MTDTDIVNLYYKDNKYIKPRYRQTWLDKHPDVYNYLINRFDDSKSIKETVYRIVNGLEHRPVCVNCGASVQYDNGHFLDYCCKSCMEKDPLTVRKREESMLHKFGVKCAGHSKELIEKRKQTNIKKYGCEFSSQNQKVKDKTALTNIKRYGKISTLAVKSIRDKGDQTKLLRYGVKHAMQSKTLKEKAQSTNIQRYGVKNVFQNETIKENIKKHNLLTKGVEYNSQSADIINKISETKRKNKTFNTSKDEVLFEQELINHNIDYTKQYKDDRYPFNCDFYIERFDLFVELNFYWSHGKHRYDCNNIDDVNRLNEMIIKNKSSYNNAIRVWTITDPLKIKTATSNELNYLCVYRDFPVKDIINLIETEYNETTKNKQCFIGEK